MSDLTLEEAEQRAGYDQAEHEPDNPHEDTSAARIVWFGDEEPKPPAWLIRGLLPAVQVAIVAGQFSAGKTFGCIDIAFCVMTGEPFLTCEIVRPGGVLWLAAEGREEVMFRLKAAAMHRTGSEDVGALPFAIQVGGVPVLTEADAFERIMDLVAEAKATLPVRFNVTDLPLIVIDTVGSAASFQDENSASETQRVFNLLRRVSDASGALVLLVDHFGKLVDTGIRGSSAKSAAADAILSVLADKNMEGKITNRRLVVEKLRQAPTGQVFPFELVSVRVDTWGNTSAAVEWTKPTISEQAVAKVKPVWGGSSRFLKSAIERAMIEQGAEVRPYGAGQKERRAVRHEHIRAEFYSAYPADTQEAKRKAFNRMMHDAIAKALVASREIAEVDWVWIVKEETEEQAPDVWNGMDLSKDNRDT